MFFAAYLLLPVPVASGEIKSSLVIWKVGGRGTRNPRGIGIDGNVAAKVPEEKLWKRHAACCGVLNGEKV